MFKPSMTSALAGLNKAVAKLRTVEANATATADAQDAVMAQARSTRNAAQMEAVHAATVAERIEALVAPV